MAQDLPAVSSDPETPVGSDHGSGTPSREGDVLVLPLTPGVKVLEGTLMPW